MRNDTNRGKIRHSLNGGLSKNGQSYLSNNGSLDKKSNKSSRLVNKSTKDGSQMKKKGTLTKLNAKPSKTSRNQQQLITQSSKNANGMHS